MATVLTVTANPLLDFLSTEQLQAGKVVRSSGFAPMAAGKGINVARVLNAFGHRAIAAGFAGGDTGAMLAGIVGNEGMEAAFVDTSARLRVGFICAANDVQPQGSLLETGFAVTKAEAQTLVDTVAARLGEADLVIIGGSVPHPSIAWCYAAILDACASAQTPCWVDSYGPGMTAALDAATPPALAKPNRQELPTTEAWERCGELHISDGPGALEIHRGDERWQVRPPVVDEVNPVGSGDCYVAGLAHGRLSGLDFADQLRWAAAAGAANAARWDVAQISAGDAEPLLPHVVVEAGAAP